jgi:hypothetical protein
MTVGVAQGRATVEMTLKKPEEGRKFDVDGEIFDKITLRMVSLYPTLVWTACSISLLE